MSLSPRRAAAIVALGLAGTTAAQGVHRFATPQPGATQKLAFDARRGRMVRVDGSVFSSVLTTWEWIGNGWSLRHTASSPPPRSDFSLGYDEARQRLVLFGGRTQLTLWAAAMLDDTWEYDGIDWVQLQPPQRPPGQINGWLGMDYAHGKLFLCGGINGSANAASWHFDGTTWTAAPTSFLGATGAGFASDPVRQRVVGYVPGSTVHLLCEWDGVAWQWVTAAAWPTPRVSTSLAWVSSLQRVVMHSGAGSPEPGDLWQYDGVAWSLLAAAPQRQGHSLCHDPVHDVLFAVGGRQQGTLGVDTLRGDGIVWTRHDPGIGWEDLRGAWFDGIRQRVVALSVYPSSWLEWNGSAWSRSPSPVALVRPRGAFDPARARTVVVGTNTQGIVTQEWDGTTWTPPAVVALPCEAKATFHPGRGRLVASCGSAGLWEWDGIAWTQFAPGPGAPWSTIADGDAVYDAARGELVLVQWQPPNVVTARWNGTAWTTGTSSGPSPRSEHALAYDAATQRVALFGGMSGSGATAVYFDDLWEWDGVAWTQRVLAAPPPARARGVLVFDAQRQQLVLFSGQRTLTPTASTPFTDTWAFDARPAGSVQTLGPGCSGTNGALQLVAGMPNAGAEVFAMEAHGAIANTPCLFAFSFAAGAVPLGAGCTLWLSAPQQVMLVTCDAAGIATVTGSIPVSLHGTSWAAQAATLDQTSLLGVTLSAGLLLVAGY